MIEKLPPLRLGLAGYGGFGRFLHRTWGAMPGVEVAAVATLHDGPEGVRVHDHWQGLLTDDAVDLVAIAVPPNLHAAVAGAAMEAGKHVIVEKPVATSLAEARRLVEVRDRTGRVATVDFMIRFTAVAEALARWGRERPFGRLRRAVVENHAQDETLPPEHWFWDPAQSGGILVEHAVHFLDLVSSMTDARAVRVDGWGHRRNARQEDRVLATVAYDDGLVATHHHTFSRPEFFERTTIRLWFDLAEVEIEGWIPLAGRVRALVGPGTEEALAALPGFSETARRPAPVREGSARRVLVGGEPFEVADEVEGTFDAGTPKPEVYAAALRALLTDVRRAMADPAHRVRVPLEDGVEAVRLALAATRDAHAPRDPLED
jgi:predicted dehydrogenase